jgi:hypothetical protein
MKRNAVLALVALAALALTLPLVSHAKDAKAKATYLVISPHTPEQCMKSIGDVNAAGSLSKWNFGCLDGDHTGYLTVTAASAEEALKNVPEEERGQAKAIRLHKFTAAELKAAHEHMADSK